MRINAQAPHQHEGFPFGIDPDCSYCQIMPVGRMGDGYYQLTGSPFINPLAFNKHKNMRAVDFIREELRKRAYP